jgi:DNA polymerase-1
MGDLSFKFPVVRNLFLCEPGYTMIDIDLAGADAQVVAWRAGDEDLKAAFRRGEKIHVKNGIDIFGRDKMYQSSNSGKSEPFYTMTKKGVHSTNYGATKAARRCGMTEKQYSQFQARWFHLHPAIKEWHKDVEHLLQTTRTISNRFGYRIPFFDRPESCFNKALAWEPQSTVAEVTYRAMRQIRKALPHVKFRMQVHDSLVYLIPNATLRSDLQILYNIIHNIVIPFDDPLIIPWGLKLGTERWGTLADTKWSDVI